MRPRLAFPRLVATCLIACAAAILMAAPSGLAASAPGIAGPDPLYTAATGAEFSWTAALPDLPGTTIRYEGGLVASPDATPTTDFGGGLSSGSIPLGGEGTYYFRVHAVEEPLPGPGPYATKTVVVDRTAPTISVALSPATPNGDNLWYRTLSLVWTCADDNLGVVCPTSGLYTTQGANQSPPGTATDAAGNLTTITTPVFSFDGAAPQAAALRQPTRGATVTSEPTFVWGPSTAAETSGYNRYEVWVRIGGTYRMVATTPHVAGQPEYRVTRDPAIWPSVLPKGVATTWSVRTVDNAGNVGGNGQTRVFTINPNAPAAPSITGGPEGLTNQSSPTFAWTGDQPGFAWELFAGAGETPVQSGSGPATQATPTGLTDGDYTFSVAQVNAFGDKGAESARSFTVDATPPAAPAITGRPPFPTTNPTPSFSWAMEAGAFARWQVLGSGGSVIQTSDTPSSSATVSALTNGAYVFRVVAIDAAGNASPPTSDPFSITGVAAPARVASLTSLLPLQNASRLRPRAGTTLLTRTPVLRWIKGPRGTTVYNLQLFKVVRKRPSLSPVMTKVYSAFPKGTQIRIPKGKTLPGTCYVWRIWPYTGKSFTTSPLGISNFCIASKAALAKAAKASAKKARR